MSRSSASRSHEHEASVSISFELAVDAPEHTPQFHYCHRNGEKKRVFDSPPPEHYFHLQYQLLPSTCSDGSSTEEDGERQMSKSDVVTFGVISKVYTEKDSRVLRCWEEEGKEDQQPGEEDGGDHNEQDKEGKRSKKRTHFGWRHKHSFKVTRALLLQLYNHTLEVRLWNTKEKVAPRARFDRPRAFRLPVEGTQDGRPDKFLIVGHDSERSPCRSERRRKRISKKGSSLTSMSEGDSDLDRSISIMEVSHSPTKAVEAIHEGDREPLTTTDQSDQTMTTNDHSDKTQAVGGDDINLPPKDHEMLTSVVLDHSNIFASQGVQKSKLHQMEAERQRLEKDGVAVLHLKMADLFAKQDKIITKLDGPIDNIRSFEVAVNLESPLMSDYLRSDLNPTVITIHKATNMPTQQIAEQMQRCDPAYVRYRFHNLPDHRTSGHSQSHDITWDDCHVILLGTIDKELLTEYLRGPPITMEVHDRDRCLEKENRETVFGSEQRDELLGTHAFGTGASDIVRQSCRPWDPFGVACFNLAGLLSGQRMIQLTTPITAGPRAPPTREDCLIGPHGRELPPPLPAGDYLDSQSYLTISIELSHSLPPSPPTINPHSDVNLNTMPTTACPFARLVYITTTDEAGQNLIDRILDHVNRSNTVALGLDQLPDDMLNRALSTYKLTRHDVEGGECDVVTGFQVRDNEVSLLVAEGLREGVISRMWAALPRHSSQDVGLVKVFYNSSYHFSRRLYGHFDVDLPLIILSHSLFSITQLALLYIRGNVTPEALRALLCLSQMVTTGRDGGGMAELVRNDLFPSVDEVSALALQFGILPGTTNHLEEDIIQCTSEREAHHSHTPIPHVSEDEDVARKVALDMNNVNYERLLGDRSEQTQIDHISRNIAVAHTLSEQAAKLPVNIQRRKMRSKSVPQTVHLYSSQTLNSAVLAKARMRAELGFDHTHKHRQLYTYCQDYHSMTFEPIDVQAETKAQRIRDSTRWKTSEGFVYPKIPNTKESNTHPHRPHSARIQELSNPFEDGLLHANTLKPTVERLMFDWDQRRDDFNRYYKVPRHFGPLPPISIHLAGQQRAVELSHTHQLASNEWHRKVVVNDTRFHTYRRGVNTELREKCGPKNKIFEDILKDPPMKYSLRREGLRLEPIPPLDVVQNLDSESHCERQQVAEREGVPWGGYQPGPSVERSLKRDDNVIPLHYQRTHSASKHEHSFRLYYHTHSPVSKRTIHPLSPSERQPPFFPASQSQHMTATTSTS